MNTHAVIQIQGKQYITQKGDDIIIENIGKEKGTEIDVPVIMLFDEHSSKIEIPKKETQGKAKVIENLQGDKIRVTKYKSKVRYRKVMGFRPQLTKIQITNI